MLPLAYLRRPHEPRVAYNSTFANRALSEFLDEVADGRETYDMGIRRMALDLYQQALKGTGASLFLDKTPRYYHIISDLTSLFPEARFVFLVRNPVSVLASRLEEVQGNWLWLATFDGLLDLTKGPGAIADGIATLKRRGVRVRYEDLVSHPEATIKRLCRYLDLEYVPEMIHYGIGHRPKASALGDKKSVDQHSQPVSDYVHAWRKALQTRVAREIARAYVEQLGEATLTGLGYSASEIVGALAVESSSQGHRLWRIVSGAPENWRRWDPLRFNILLGLAEGGFRGAIAGGLRSYRRRQIRRRRAWQEAQGSFQPRSTETT